MESGKADTSEFQSYQQEFPHLLKTSKNNAKFNKYVPISLKKHEKQGEKRRKMFYKG